MKNIITYSLVLFIVIVGYSQSSKKILGSYSGSEKCNKGIDKNTWSERYSIKIIEEKGQYYIIDFYYIGSKKKIKIKVGSKNSFSHL